MSHRNRKRNPFRKSTTSPFDHNGPNHEALRRGLERLATQDPNSPHPDSVELRKASEKLLAPTEEQHAPDEPITSVKTESEPEPFPNPEAAQAEEKRREAAEPKGVEPKEAAAEPAAPEATPSEPALAAPAEAKPETPAAQPEAPEPAAEEAPIGEPTDEDLEAAAIHAAQRADRDPLVRARRIRRRKPGAKTDPTRHRRLCAICNHQELDAIEDAFLHWQRPGDIKFEFKLPNRLCIYRHAHAFGLFEERAKNMRFTLENLLEESSRCRVSGDTIIRAVRAHSCLDSDGHWIEPPRHLIISREPHKHPAKALVAGKEITVEPKVIEKGA